MASECAAGTAAGVGMRRVAAAFESAQRLVLTVPTTRIDDSAMAAFVGGLVPQLKAVEVGETLLIPASLTDASGANEAVLVGAQRTGPRRFCVCLLAAGPSLQYHAVRVDEHTAGFEHHAALVLDSVPEERLADGAFWFLFFSAQLPTKSGGKAPTWSRVRGKAKK